MASEKDVDTNGRTAGGIFHSKRGPAAIEVSGRGGEREDGHVTGSGVVVFQVDIVGYQSIFHMGVETDEIPSAHHVKVIKTVSKEIMRERLRYASNPFVDAAFPTQAEALAHRRGYMKNSGFVVAQDKHTLEGGRIANPITESKELKAKKEYYAFGMEDFYREYKARSRDFRNFYELAVPNMPVHIYVDLDGDAGDGHTFATVSEFLENEHRFIDPFEEFLVDRLGLANAANDLHRVILDASDPGRGKISRHYVWEVRGMMMASNLHLAHLVQDFEVYLMSRSLTEDGRPAMLPHVPGNIWYELKSKRPYPKFIFDYIYTSCRVFRSEGSCKFGATTVLHRATLGEMGSPCEICTLDEILESSIFYPHHDFVDCGDDISIVEYLYVPERTLADAPALIAHWPPEAFDGTEKVASNNWYLANIVLEGPNQLARPRYGDGLGDAESTLAAARGGNYNYIQSTVRAQAIRLDFVQGALDAILNNAVPHYRDHCHFVGPMSYRFNPLNMSLIIATTNRYCPARAADSKYATSLHTNNKTSITLYLRDMTVRWHCFSTNHLSPDESTYLHKLYRAEDESMILEARMLANLFIEEYQQGNSMDAMYVLRAALSKR